jgi:hypothetical protein
MKKIALFGLVVLFASMTLFGVVFGNHGESGYIGGSEGYKAIDNPLKIMIITGAGNFIQSQALYQQLLHKIELAELYGVNYDELRGMINDTLVNIDSARTAYYDFIKLAAVTPYNESFIAALGSFDYDGFRLKNHLNVIIFSKLAALLKNGNLTGVYEEIYQKTGEISRLLHVVKASVDKDIFPGIPVLWEINRVYFDSYLFGQYAAMIFTNIK